MGTQSSIIVVRGIATGRIAGHNLLRFWTQEMLIGAGMGLYCGLLAGAVALLWQGDLCLAVAVSSAMACSLVVAATLGVLMPFLLARLSIDPAISAGPFVTTLQDVLATLIYFSFALAIFSPEGRCP